MLVDKGPNLTLSDLEQALNLIRHASMSQQPREAAAKGTRGRRKGLVTDRNRSTKSSLSVSLSTHLVEHITEVTQKDALIPPVPDLTGDGDGSSSRLVGQPQRALLLVEHAEVAETQTLTPPIPDLSGDDERSGDVLNGLLDLALLTIEETEIADEVAFTPTVPDGSVRIDGLLEIFDASTHLTLILEECAEVAQRLGLSALISMPTSQLEPGLKAALCVEIPTLLVLDAAQLQEPGCLRQVQISGFLRDLHFLTFDLSPSIVHPSLCSYPRRRHLRGMVTIQGSTRTLPAR